MHYCVCVKRITLCNCLCSPSSPSSSYFSGSHVRNFKIVNWYFWFWKSLHMADQGGEFGFSHGVHVRTDIRIDIYIFISVRPMATKFGKQEHLCEFTQMRLIKQVLVTLSRQDHVTNLMYCISTNTISMAIKLGRMVANLKQLLTMLLYLLFTWSCKITWQTKIDKLILWSSYP